MKVLIAGGGSAGWITAASLIKAYPEANITLVESSNIPTIGVGESAIQSIRELLSFLDIKDEDWMKHCNAIYKGSIDFTGWGEGSNTRVKEPFGVSKDLGFSNRDTYSFWDWSRKKYILGAEEGEFHTFAVEWGELLNSNKVTKEPMEELGDWDFERCTSFHLDAGLLAEYLKNHFCKPRGVTHIIGDIKEVLKSSDSYVSKVVLTNGEELTADMYVDCTGFRRVLINEVGGDFHSFKDILINDRAVATRVPYKDKETEMEFNTNATTLDNGWVWNIPLWDRIGAGYVYSSKFLTEQEAEEELRQHLSKNRSSEELDSLDYFHINMKLGAVKDPFIGNVCSIGLSHGFIEPLGSTGLHLIIAASQALVSLLSDRGMITSIERGLFNRQMQLQLQIFTNIVSARYASSRRNDTEYWKYLHNIDYISPSEQIFIRDFLLSMKGLGTEDRDYGLFEYMLAGNMGINPYSPLTTFSDTDIERSYKLKRDLDMRRSKQIEAIKSLPSLFEFMKQHIYGDTP